ARVKAPRVQAVRQVSDRLEADDARVELRIGRETGAAIEPTELEEQRSLHHLCAMVGEVLRIDLVRPRPIGIHEAGPARSSDDSVRSDGAALRSTDGKNARL